MTAVKVTGSSKLAPRPPLFAFNRIDNLVPFAAGIGDPRALLAFALDPPTALLIYKPHVPPDPPPGVDISRKANPYVLFLTQLCQMLEQVTVGTLGIRRDCVVRMDNYVDEAVLF